MSRVGSLVAGALRAGASLDNDGLFARQFVAGPDASTLRLAGFRQYLFAGTQPIAVHELAPVSEITAAHCTLLCIGHVFDPRQPQLDNHGVLRNLAEHSHTFEALERASAGLAGRWLLFAKVGGEARLYPDAAGSRAAFYAPAERGLWIASQPGILSHVAGLESDRKLVAKLWQHPGATAWPAARTPYPGVRQLLPNRYLDLGSATAKRFWPTQRIPEVGTDDAALAMGQLLTGTLRAIAARGGELSIPLTGGLDSRTLLACARETRHRFRYFTIADATSPFHDVWIPRRLASKFGLNFRFVWAPRSTQEQIDLLRANTGELWRDPNEHRSVAFGRIRSSVMLLGNVSEVCRCYYYNDGAQPHTVDAAVLAKLFGWDDDELAVESLREWLSEFPAGLNLDTLDAFYWEARAGNWASLACMALDAYADVVSPFNCREFLQIGLGVHVADRIQPYNLYRQICVLAEPRALELPINTTWLSSAQGRLRDLLPAEVRSSIRRARRRLAGTRDKA